MPESTLNILPLLRTHYPDWTGFADERFVQDEVVYKQATVTLARELLSQPEIERLIAAGAYDELLSRFDRVGKKSKNLLFVSIPQSSDLSVLYQPDLDKPAFCAAMLDLLYGPGASPARIGRYAAFVEKHNLPKRWTFPTYFLFVCHPESEMYIKPSVFGWFFGWIGEPNAWSRFPSAETYARVLALAGELRTALAEYGPHDMVDIHSAIWVAYRETTATTQLGAPFNKIFANYEEAYQAFDLLADTAARLGLTGPHDARGAFTVRRVPGRVILRLNFGAWALLSIGGLKGRVKKIGLALLADKAQRLADLEDQSQFKCRDDEPQIDLCSFSAQAWPLPAPLTELFRETLAHVVRHFQGWERSPYHVYGVPAFAEAVFNLDARDRLLREGVDEREASDDEAIEADEAVDEADAPEIDASVEPTPIPTPQTNPNYTLETLIADTGLEADRVQSWLRALDRKRQVILYGPPGTGKTFVARKLAQHLIGGTAGFMEILQFHPAYAYEDFVQGLRPLAKRGGLHYEMVPGRFLQFCAKAAQRNGPCVLILDEINRANLARVLGELMFALEYRDEPVQLAGGQPFRIPANVRIIGTLNTADRSIALVDHAMRRRFAFLALYPDYAMLEHYHVRERTGFPATQLAAVLRSLNEQIGNPHYAVGISFFLRPDVAAQLPDIWRMEIEPYLEEYFFDQPATVDEYRWARIASKVIA